MRSGTAGAVHAAATAEAVEPAGWSAAGAVGSEAGTTGAVRTETGAAETAMPRPAGAAVPVMVTIAAKTQNDGGIPAVVAGVPAIIAAIARAIIAAIGGGIAAAVAVIGTDDAAGQGENNCEAGGHPFDEMWPHGKMPCCLHGI
jgi:hypothetical protein